MIIFLPRLSHFIGFRGLGVSAPLCAKGSGFEFSLTGKIQPFFVDPVQKCCYKEGKIDHTHAMKAYEGR